MVLSVGKQTMLDGLEFKNSEKSILAEAGYKMYEEDYSCSNVMLRRV